MGYLSNFIVYTFAMIGVIMLALLVYKTSTNGTHRSGSKILKIQDTLSIGPRKTLYIVSAGEEKFLIAGDVDKTTLISKLNVREETETIMSTLNNFKDALEDTPQKNSYMDRKNLGINPVQNKQYNSVMKNLAERLKDNSSVTQNIRN